MRLAAWRPSARMSCPVFPPYQHHHCVQNIHLDLLSPYLHSWPGKFYALPIGLDEPMIGFDKVKGHKKSFR